MQVKVIVDGKTGRETVVRARSVKGKGDTLAVFSNYGRAAQERVADYLAAKRHTVVERIVDSLTGAQERLLKETERAA